MRKITVLALGQRVSRSYSTADAFCEAIDNIIHAIDSFERLNATIVIDDGTNVLSFFRCIPDQGSAACRKIG